MLMVTESFGYRPSPRDWSNLFSKSQKKKTFRIGTLYMVMVYSFFQKVKFTKKKVNFQIETLYMVIGH